MLYNGNKVVNHAETEEILSFSEFKNMVNYKAISATNSSNAFSLFMFDIKSIYSACLTKGYDLNKLISNIIYKNTRKQKDFFSIDRHGRFLILFSETSPISIYMPISRILNEIRKNLGDFIDISIGAAYCPQGGINSEQLFESLITSLMSSKREKVLSAFKNLSEVDLKEEVKESYYKVEETRSNFNKLTFLIEQVNKYNSYLKMHTARVAMGSINLAQEMELEWSEIEKIAISSILHDVGYTLIPPNLFRKENFGDHDVNRILKLHPIIASEKILKPLGVFEKYLPLIENHHEFLDGTGFPKAKKGHQIEIGAQIISVVDSYCSLVIENLGFKEYKVEDIISIYTKNAGIKWDMDVITSFTSMLADPTIREKLLRTSNLSN